MSHSALLPRCHQRGYEGVAAAVRRWGDEPHGWAATLSPAFVPRYYGAAYQRGYEFPFSIFGTRALLVTDVFAC